MFSDATKLFERVLFLDESLRQLPTPKIDRDCAKYRRTLSELNWQQKCQKEKDKFVVCLCSAHKKKCTARPRPVFSAVFVAQNTIFTDFKSLYWPLSR